ncbi:hypothetical protein ACTOV4_10560 [Brucella sp. C7-11G]
MGYVYLKKFCMQDKPELNDIYQLIKINDKYIMYSLGHKLPVIADGYFAFVIPIEIRNPRIICGVPVRPEPNNLNDDKLIGHGSLASISGTENPSVYYAGNISLENGKIIKWNNKSGHYKPSIDEIDFIPDNLKNLLPTEYFVGHTFIEENEIKNIHLKDYIATSNIPKYCSSHKSSDRLYYPVARGSESHGLNQGQKPRICPRYLARGISDDRINQSLGELNFISTENIFQNYLNRYCCLI